MAACEPSAFLILSNAELAKHLPLERRDGAPRGNLAGLGAAVDLVQWYAKARFGQRGELRRKRRRRAKQEIERRHLGAAVEERAQVDGRGDQPAWPGQGF